MKLIVKVDPTVGQLMRSLKRKINNFIFTWFKKPYLNYQQRRFEKRKIAAIHREFEINFKMSPSSVVNLMHKSDAAAARSSLPKSVKMSDKEYKEFLSEERRISALKYSHKDSPLFYDPEIVDIHNELLEYNGGPHIKQLIANETTKAGRELRNQEKKTPVLNVVPKQSTQFPKAPSMTRETDLTVIKKADNDKVRENFSKFMDDLSSVLKKS